MQPNFAHASFVRACAFAALLGLGAGACPARAADDGQASLITGLGQSFGLMKSDDGRKIDYRERAKLVVPPKKALPPPVESARDGAWPQDVEFAREKKFKKIEDGGPSAREISSRNYQFYHPGDDVQVTTSGFDGHGPACRHPDPKTGECPGAPKPSLELNPLKWVGLQKKSAVVLGPEPERETLEEPPKGLRAPAEGVGAKVED